MTHTFHIDGSSQKAKALLDFLRTLEFVKEDKENNSILSSKHLQIVEERRVNRMNGSSNTKSWQEVKNSLGQKNKGI